MIDSRKPRMPILPWTRWERGASLLRGGRFKTRDPEPNPVDFKIVEDWTEEFSDEPLIRIKEVLWVAPRAEANGSWWEDPSDWEVHTPRLTPVAPKALPYLEEVNKGCWLKKNAHDGDWARWNSFRNACVVRQRSDEEFYKGVPRGFKGAIQENIRFQQVLMFGQQYNISKKGRDRRCRKVKMNLVNKGAAVPIWE